MINFAHLKGSLLPASNIFRSGLLGVIGLAMVIFLPNQGLKATTLDKSTGFPGGGQIAGRVLDLIERNIDTSKPLGFCDPASSHDELVIELPNIQPLRGNIRISLYSGDYNEWLERERKLVRYDVPVTTAHMTICMPLPFGPADYAVGLYHDEDADQKYDWPSESYGFSNNAKPAFLGPPSHKQVVFTAGPGRTPMTIYIRY